MMLIFANTLAGYFKSEIEQESISIRPQHEFSNILAAPSASEIDELADKSESLEQRVASLNDSYEILRKREVELIEWRWVLTEAGGFFDRVVYIHCPQIKLHQSNFICRLMVTLKRFDTPPTTTRRPFSKMLSSKREVRTEMRLASRYLS